MASEVWLCVLDSEHGNDCVGVTVAHLVFGLQEGNLLHVSLARNLFEFGHPVINWLAILLFD